jgi:hypothetical protein
LALNTNAIAKNAASPGIGCNAQGFFITAGDLASAWWTLTIAGHTFLVLAGGSKWKNWAAEKSTEGKGRWVLAFVIWSVSVFLSSIGIAIELIYPQNGAFCTVLYIAVSNRRQQQRTWLVLDGRRLLLGTNFLALLYGGSLIAN